MSKLIKVQFTYEDGSGLMLEGEEAEKWRQYGYSGLSPQKFNWREVSGDENAACDELVKALTDNYGGWKGAELLIAASEHCDDSIIGDLLRYRAAREAAALIRMKVLK